MNQITYKLSGRLGNHLQLWACARTLSLRYGWELLYRPIIHGQDFRLAQAYAGKQLGLLSTVTAQMRGRLVRLYDHSWDESGFMAGQAKASVQTSQGKLFILNWGGIFRHIDEFRPQLIGELLGNHLQAVPPNPDSRSVGVHIRRDDAQYPQPISYYVAALEQIEKKVGQPVRIHLFSDGDPVALGDELKKHLPGREIMVQRQTVVQDMLKLATFQNLVISQSWFSYWSAFLSHDATIYAPKDFCYYPHWLTV